MSNDVQEQLKQAYAAAEQAWSEYDRRRLHAEAAWDEYMKRNAELDVIRLKLIKGAA